MTNIRVNSQEDTFTNSCSGNRRLPAIAFIYVHLCPSVPSGTTLVKSDHLCRILNLQHPEFAAS